MLADTILRPLTAWSPSAEAAVRVGYGLLLTLQLLMTVRQAKRFFVSETYGGYMESSPLRDLVLRPAVAHVLMGVWVAAAIGIMTNTWLLVATAVHFVLARYFFVKTRWASILRGMGAPGHMNHWIGAFMFLLALSHVIDDHGLLRGVTVLTFRIDFAAMMLMAGIYKLTAGYAHGDGFERGLVNPWWGFWARPLQRAPAHSVVFRFFNHSAWLAEVICPALWLFPPAAPYAAAFFAASFLGIAVSIRLTFLAEMVALCCVMYVYPGTAPDTLLSSWLPVAAPAPTAGPLTTVIVYPLVALMGVFLVALPVAYAGMSINFYRKTRLPHVLQTALDRWSRFFGLILWRVFTADVINFYARIVLRGPDATTGEEYLLMKPWDGRSQWRYMHVGEFICLASIFTTLKYYPTNRALFDTRIVRYARTLPIPRGGDVVFEYHSVLKGRERFEFPQVARFTVNPMTSTVSEEVVDAAVDVRAPARISPVAPGEVPGSYAPAR